MIDKMMQQQSGPQRPRKMGNFKGPGGNKKPQGEDGFQWLRIFRTLTFWSVIIFVALWLANQFGTQPEPEIEIEYSQFQTLMYSYAINSATIEGRELHGEIFSNAVDILDEQLQDTDLKLSAVRRKQALGLTDERVLVPRQLALENQLEKFEQLKPGLLEVLDEMEVLLKFSVLLSEPPSTSVAEKWSTYIKNFKFEPQSTQWTQLLLNLAPWVLMIGFWMFLMRRMQGGGGSNKGIFSFGKSKAKLISEDSIKVTFDDVAGADEAKQELQEIIEFLKEPEKFQRLGGK
ncbi:hypothetical protein KAH55_08375, partial [bacterium]|nr:hypothetical protein [bacterium]